jgi:hypothetical protein
MVCICLIFEQSPIGIKVRQDSSTILATGEFAPWKKKTPQRDHLKQRGLSATECLSFLSFLVTGGGARR